MSDTFLVQLLLVVYVPVAACAWPLIRWSRRGTGPFDSPARFLVLGPLAASGAVLLVASLASPASRLLAGLLLARALWHECRRV